MAFCGVFWFSLLLLPSVRGWNIKLPETVPDLGLGLDLGTFAGAANTILDELDTDNNGENKVYTLLSVPRIQVERDDLICNGCDGEDVSKEDCCSCRWVPTWSNQEENLEIEHISVRGKSLVVPFEAVKNNTVYKIEVNQADMGEIPSNICNWDTDETVIVNYRQTILDFEPFWDEIVKIDFTGNKIRKLTNLDCMTNLDTLLLGYNHIVHLTNSSFAHLTHLRILNISDNLITTMDSSVLSTPSLHLASVDLKNNQLHEMDITNAMSLYPFCDIDVSDNFIRLLTNVHDYKLDPSMIFGPGYVNFQGNAMTSFPNLKNLLNLCSIQELGQLLHFGFDLRRNPIVCNGLIEPYLAVARQLPKPFWREYMDVKCIGPETLVGRLIRDIGLDELVTDHQCYQSCACQDRPSQNYVYVDCSGRGITDLSKGELPVVEFCENIYLNLSNNDIKVIDNIPNLDRVTVLDVSDNDVVEITEEAALMLENLTSLILTNNTDLRTIPPQFQYVDSCNFYLDGMSFDCDCDSTWISDWTKKSSCDDNRTMFQCRVPEHGVMLADAFREEMLDCKPEDSFISTLVTALAMSILALVITAVMTYQLRYEILVILLRLRRRKRNSVLPTIPYDVFLSFDEENARLRKWVNTELVPELERIGYQTFLTYRDIDFGSVRANVTIDVMAKTRNFLAILSQPYNDTETVRWTDFEWKQGWNAFLTNSFKNMVMVNYDHLSSFDVDHPQIKAFLRVGGAVNFTNDGRNIMKQIAAKLGPPLTGNMPRNAAFENAKGTFDVTKLFNVSRYVEDNSDTLQDPLRNFQAHMAFINRNTKFDKSTLYMGEIQTTGNCANIRRMSDVSDGCSTDDQSLSTD